MAESLLAPHPAADLFPLLEGEEFEALAADIAANGLREPITLHKDGRVLDGRNRARACEIAGVIARFATYEGDDTVGFVISANLKRRHLNYDQRVAVAVKIANMRQGERMDLQPSANLQKVSQADAAKMVGVSTRSVASGHKVYTSGAPSLVHAFEQGRVAVSRAAEIADLDPEIQDMLAELPEKDIIDNHERLKRDARRADSFHHIMAETPSMPEARFPVVYADPPWRFGFWSRDTANRMPDEHYATMELPAIKALNVPAADNAILFLWATAPMLMEALDVMMTWGFAYKSNIVWAKDRIGTGYWTRNKHEHLLIATRGDIPAPAPGTQWPSVIEAPVRDHSRKPDEAYEIIETYFPTLPKIELFARGPARPGWVVWGNEAAPAVAVE
jgi:N6-adenosine-specific RNA methylase IME4